MTINEQIEYLKGLQEDFRHNYRNGYYKVTSKDLNALVWILAELAHLKRELDQEASNLQSANSDYLSIYMPVPNPDYSKKWNHSYSGTSIGSHGSYPPTQSEK